MKRRLSPESRVIFLDYDGCLHPGAVYRTRRLGIHLRGHPGLSLFCWSGILVELLDPHPDVVLVLSTSWVKSLRFSQAKLRLPIALQERVVSATWHSSMNLAEWEALTRYGQIMQSVTRHKLRRWLAIDDDTFRWPDISRHRLVICDEHRGLSDPATEEDLRRKLEIL